jgi:hypothetical protein
MKLDSASSEKLKAHLRERADKSGLNYSEIARIAEVHPSQASRICRGEFRTLSHNVVQVCKALQIPIETVELDKSAADDRIVRRLQQSVLDVWDHTPVDGERVINFLRLLAALRRAG